MAIAKTDKMNSLTHEHPSLMGTGSAGVVVATMAYSFLASNNGSELTPRTTQANLKRHRGEYYTQSGAWRDVCAISYLIHSSLI